MNTRPHKVQALKMPRRKAISVIFNGPIESKTLPVGTNSSNNKIKNDSIRKYGILMDFLLILAVI